MILSYYLTHYKSVPEGYELTEEDKINLERDDYEMSTGSDEIEYYDVYSVHWDIKDLQYGLLVFDTEMTSEELFEMAQEVIDVE
ncbi:MAG: hypothetical protein J6F30_16585 [Cellulosilyticum sp.]|nr:hypothetical protein [Cellulosilyticum sp.]